MEKYYLAIDIGASSGRHMLGTIINRKIVLEEIYRFENGMKKVDGSLVWDTQYLYEEIIAGIRKCKDIGKIPQTIGIDTWAVDYVLLDSEDKVIGKTYGYRDKRNNHMDKEVYKIISEQDLYFRTGIQKQKFNTIYQLMANKVLDKNLDKAKTFLMLPDYFNFLLTGVKKSEYTNATSTQLVSPETKMWDTELIEMLGYNKEMFLELSNPGTEVGEFTKDVQKEVGFNCKVILPATHDTASAVVAMPLCDGEGIYISSGTWSLMGVENSNAICSQESMKANLTNEGGYNYRFRLLKNIMGMWMIQSVRNEMKNKMTFPQICIEAEICNTFPSRVNVNDECFLAPDNMSNMVCEYCRNTGQIIPADIGEMAAVIYQSLAECYAKTAKEIEKITGKVYDTIYIIGGGSNADYLNRLTAISSGKIVKAGPNEATAIGNIVVQMITDSVFTDIYEARKCIAESFDIRQY